MTPTLAPASLDVVMAQLKSHELRLLVDHEIVLVGGGENVAGFF